MFDPMPRYYDTLAKSEMQQKQRNGICWDAREAAAAKPMGEIWILQPVAECQYIDAKILKNGPLCFMWR